ncbi:MAG: NRDE family protein [Leptospirales bacterium]|nr:NRDE family protein [Leptospirales bacterium]
MCTLSGIPSGVFMFSRDELKSRREALPPSILRSGDRRLLAPMDADAGGTWIGVNDQGLLVALLNRYDGPGQAFPVRSRGLLVRDLLAGISLKRAEENLKRLELRRYDPFTLLLVQWGDAILARWDLSHLVIEPLDLNVPFMLTSSGLGDSFVEGPRRKLFRELISNNDLGEGQMLFHAHTWRDQPEISVRMERADACTVSITRVELRSDRATMAYAVSKENRSSLVFQPALSLRLMKRAMALSYAGQPQEVDSEHKQNFRSGGVRDRSGFRGQSQRAASDGALARPGHRRVK